MSSAAVVIGALRVNVKATYTSFAARYISILNSIPEYNESLTEQFNSLTTSDKNS